MPAEVTSANFHVVLAEHRIVVVAWWAKCIAASVKQVAILESAATVHPDVRFASIDTEAEPMLTGALHIGNLPTTMIFRDTRLVYAQTGVVSAEVLEGLLARVRTLDLTTGEFVALA